MTVKELLEILSELDGEMIVYVDPDWMGIPTSADFASVVKIQNGEITATKDDPEEYDEAEGDIAFAIG